MTLEVGVQGGREAREGGARDVIVIDLHCCVAETSTTP